MMGGISPYADCPGIIEIKLSARRKWILKLSFFLLIWILIGMCFLCLIISAGLGDICILSYDSSFLYILVLHQNMVWAATLFMKYFQSICLLFRLHPKQNSFPATTSAVSLHSSAHLYTQGATITTRVYSLKSLLDIKQNLWHMRSKCSGLTSL